MQGDLSLATILCQLSRSAPYASAGSKKRAERQRRAQPDQFQLPSLLSLLPLRSNNSTCVMTEAEIKDEFGHLWTNELEQHVLLQNSAFGMGYIILRKTDKFMVIIDDDAAAKYVLAQLLHNGCTVLTTAP
jgi:hypothetical protein